MESQVRGIAPHNSDKATCSAHGGAAGCGTLVADVVLADAGSDDILWAVCARWLRENQSAVEWLRSHPEQAAQLGHY